jgi:hypothetical protein
VGTRADLLTTQIEETKQELARDLADFRVELDALRRRAMIAAGAAVAAYVLWRIVRRARRRG